MPTTPTTNVYPLCILHLLQQILSVICSLLGARSVPEYRSSRTFLSGETKVLPIYPIEWGWDGCPLMPPGSTSSAAPRHKEHSISLMLRSEISGLSHIETTAGSAALKAYKAQL
jgi:hypothetical protein